LAGGGEAKIERRGQAQKPGSPGILNRITPRLKAGKALVSEMEGGNSWQYE
jgi:hypothetical protein